MQKYRPVLCRRAIFHLIDSLVIVAFLTIWLVTRPAVRTGQPILCDRASDHVLVQLAELPDHPDARSHAIPMWTLYGDGTLIFRTLRFLSKQKRCCFADPSAPRCRLVPR